MGRAFRHARGGVGELTASCTICHFSSGDRSTDLRVVSSHAASRLEAVLRRVVHVMEIDNMTSSMISSEAAMSRELNRTHFG